MKLLFIILICLFNPLTSSLQAKSSHQKVAEWAFAPLNSYPRNPYVSDEVWDKMEPFFLPLDHPLKKKLDRIFKKRVLQRRKTARKAGFKNPTPRRFSATVVTTHKKMKGYFFKFFLDAQEDQIDWAGLHKRVLGAHLLNESIHKLGVSHLFKVPKKWIYPLPAEPHPLSKINRKNFILIAEDIKPHHGHSNARLWKAVNNGQILDHLLFLINQFGLADSVIIQNIPFCEDGKIAFIDTERLFDWAIYYPRLLIYLSPAMQNYWKTIYTPHLK